MRIRFNEAQRFWTGAWIIGLVGMITYCPWVIHYVPASSYTLPPPAGAPTIKIITTSVTAARSEYGWICDPPQESRVDMQRLALQALAWSLLAGGLVAACGDARKGDGR